MKTITKNPILQCVKEIEECFKRNQIYPNVVVCGPESYLDLKQCADYTNSQFNNAGEFIFQGVKIEVDKNTIGFSARVRKTDK